MRAALLAIVLTASLSARADELRRFALVAGNDEGGEGTRPLLYAREDAKRMHGILTRLGGVQPDDAVLLLDQSADKFLSALSELERKSRDASRAGARTAIVVYYSGHAQHGALRLGESGLPFESLKSRLAQAPADVRIGIFDACQSGALTRTKGARKAPAFDIEAQPSRDAKGLVILTSSAADEDSQESDAIAGSYFSHHLASGLLGDADRSADGRVTLAEAYAYAYDRTVADTAESLAGAQHPTFSYDLAGNGDVVVTDLLRSGDGLALPAAAPGGVYFLVDARGQVAAEVWKPENEERKIAIAPGSYRVKRRLPDRLRIGEVTVQGGQLAVLDEARLRDAPFSDDPVKGLSSAFRSKNHWALFAAGGYQSFFDRATRDTLFPATRLLGVEAELRDYFRSDWTWGFDLALGGAPGQVAISGALLPYQFSELQLGSSLVAEFPLGTVIPFVGARVTFLAFTRDFADAGVPLQNLYTFSPGLVGGLTVRLGRAFRLTGRGRVNYLLYNIDENRSLGYWELSLAVGYEL